jgi:D-serine ammonia-lyase
VEQVLYGFPVPPSSVSRLATLAKQLGPRGLSVLVDHPGQLPAVCEIKKQSGIPPQVFVKVDMGSRRAGVSFQNRAASQLISDLLRAEQTGDVHFHGLYTHAGHSYAGNDTRNALSLLCQEFEALLLANEVVRSESPGKKLIFSVGATPTTTSIRNLFVQNSETAVGEEKSAIAALKTTLVKIKTEGCEVELHAGVYPILDVQQLATHALPSTGPNSMLSWSDLALTILTEVVSYYPGRGKDGRPEALVSAGSLALGREPCKAYPGWGIVSPWNVSDTPLPNFDPENHEGWEVSRISQEHGILTWSGGNEVKPLSIGQKIRIWPNHACISGACFDWYLVIDSDRKGSEDEIVDVWPRWRGW